MALTRLSGTYDFVLVTNNRGVARSDLTTFPDLFRLVWMLSSRVPRLVSEYCLPAYEASRGRVGGAGLTGGRFAMTFDSSVELTWAGVTIEGCCPLCGITFVAPEFQVLALADTLSNEHALRVGQIAFAKCPLDGQSHYFTREEEEVLSQVVDVLWGAESFGCRAADLKSLIARYSMRFVAPERFPTV